jgi:LPS export ABC transporter protein LptC/lipopolysaccharide transport protein LptA
MSKRSITILALLFAILVVEIVILVPGEVGVVPSVSKPETASDKSGAQNEGAGQLMQDAHVVEASSGSKQWELWAKKGIRPKDLANWTIEEVEVKFFAKNGVTYKVTGDKGYVSSTQQNDVRNVRIVGNVVTHSNNGYTFKTQSALYETSQHLLKTPGDVEMIGPTEGDGTHLNLRGTDMLANLDTNTIEIQQNVKAEKNIRDQKTMHISSRKAYFSGVANLARFEGDVIIDIDTIRITGPEAVFTYKNKVVDSVLIAGGVRVTDENKYATADRVSVHFDEDKYVFNGSPRVVQNGDELVGDEIVFLNNGHKVQVSNAHANLERKDLEEHKAPGFH